MIRASFTKAKRTIDMTPCVTNLRGNRLWFISLFVAIGKMTNTKFSEREKLDESAIPCITERVNTITWTLGTHFQLRSKKSLMFVKLNPLHMGYAYINDHTVVGS